MVNKWDVTIPSLTGKRRRKAYIYLPEDYDEDPDKRYPVMYMFDGHNVFFDEDATYGKSWGMNDYMLSTGKELIIVAVECNHKGNGRLKEYSPVDFENGTLGKIDGKGKRYMDWTVKVLKPYIDKKYRTLRGREHTMICGSSMGGLMALYAVCCYNKVFSMAAALSPSIWVDQQQVNGLIENAKIKPDTVIYMDYGSQELGNHAENRTALTATLNILLGKGVNLTFRIVPGGDHSEASWEKQIPVFMECLGI